VAGVMVFRGRCRVIAGAETNLRLRKFQVLRRKFKERMEFKGSLRNKQRPDTLLAASHALVKLKE